MLWLLLLTGAHPAASYDFLIQGAVDTELQPLLTALQNKKQVHLAAWTFWTGRIGKHKVVISRTEVGPMNAAAATALGIRKFRPKAIVNQGTAGGHDPKLPLWEIVVGVETVDYGAFKSSHGDEGTGSDPRRWTPLYPRLRFDPLQPPKEFRSFPGDPKLIAWAEGGKYDRGRVRKGMIGSAFQFNRELDRIKYIYETYKTDTEDMESAFAAGVAAGMGVPFVAIRIVSDNEWHHPNFERIAGQYCAEYVLGLLR